MGILHDLFRKPSSTKPDARPALEIAREVVAKYQQRSKKSAAGAEDNLLADLCQHMPEPAARELVGYFKDRCGRGDAEAVQKFAAKIAIAIADARHWLATSHPILVPSRQDPDPVDNQPASARKSYEKVVQGRALTSEDEDAILFSDYLW